MRDIHVLTTGGTIDKVYGVSGLLEIGPPAFQALMAPVLTDLRFVVTPVLAVDSLDMTEPDREQLCRAVEAVDGDLVLITHGTDTMAATARHLAEHLSPAARSKVVVLTGAMQPAAMRVSDASYNLGTATAALQLLPPGVHIAMSGRVFRADEVVKDTTRGVFVEAPSPDLERILRWERQGGEWQVLTTGADAVTVALMRCDAGEEIDRLTSSAPDVLRHVAGAD
ncbi:MAG: asparaginase [Nocardioidaceae bacterium]|nr:asparaginase [Nocardioidaceae bacterium]MCL2613858.1 asparaginase [Nocardioidaceae bacterium]